MANHKSWTTITDLAEQIGMSKKTVWSWIKARKLKSVRYGSQHRIYDDDWRRFLLACNRKPVSHERKP